MGLLADWQIAELAEQGMIMPFVDRQVREGNISYGLSSYGYDIRVDNKFKIMYPPPAPLYEETIVDPKNIDVNLFTDVATSVCIIQPNSYVLARSVETFDMPANVTGVCVGKSTYVRSGIHILMSPLEASWKGVLTLEIANLTPYPAKIYANEGIAQILFFRGDEDNSEEQRVARIVRQHFHLARMLSASVLVISQSTVDKEVSKKTFIAGPDGTRYSKAIKHATDIQVEMWNPVSLRRQGHTIVVPDRAEYCLDYPHLFVQKYRGAAEGAEIPLGWIPESTTFYDQDINFGMNSGKEIIFTHLQDAWTKYKGQENAW